MEKTEIHIIRAVLYGLSVKGSVSIPSWGHLAIHSVSPESTMTSIEPPQRSMVFQEDQNAKDDISLFFTEKLGYHIDESQAVVLQYFKKARQSIVSQDLEWQGFGRFFKTEGGEIGFQAADQWSKFINPAWTAVPIPQGQSEVLSTVDDISAVAAAQSGQEPETSSEAREMGRSWIWVILTFLTFLLCIFWIIRTRSMQSSLPDLNIPTSSEFFTDSSFDKSSETMTFTDEVSAKVRDYPEEQELPLDNDSGSGATVTREEDELPSVPEDSEPQVSPIIAEEDAPPTRSIPDPAVSGPQCIVVVGAFASENNAHKTIQRLQGGFDRVYHQDHSGLTRVGVQCSCGQVAQVQETLRQNYQLSSWFYKL